MKQPYQNPQSENNVDYEAESDFVKIFNDREPEDLYI